MTRKLAFVAVVIAVGACTPSRVNPNANISIDGTVQRAGGTPVRHAKVSLRGESGGSEFFLTVVSLGLVCLDRQDAPALCKGSRIATTGSTGAFAFHLKGRDTQSLGFSEVLDLETAGEPNADEVAGSSTTYRFHVQTEKLDLPIRLWEPTVAAKTGSFGARVAFSRFPAGLLPRQIDRGARRYSIAFSRGDELVWVIDGARPDTVFDPRVLEDSTGTMRVIAEDQSIHVPETLGDEVAYALSSASRAYESPLDAPLSRGASCAVVDDRGNRTPVSPCRLTDGVFSEEFRPSVCAGQSGCVEPPHGAAVVDLGRVAPIDLVVVRGCGFTSTCRVETSADARSWRLAGVVQSEDRAAFSLGKPQPVRYVRVTSGFVDDLTEVSAWAGRPALPGASLLVAPERFRLSQGRNPSASSPGESSHFNRWALAAAALLGAVGGALAVLLLRRKGRPAA
jgi:hypothetical protein